MKKEISLADIRGDSASFRALNPVVFGLPKKGAVQSDPASATATLRAGATKDRQPRQMTRTEREFEAMLRFEFPASAIHWEWYRLRLGGSCWYTPDFAVVANSVGTNERPPHSVMFFEVKGAYLFKGATKSATASSLTKPKSAATLYPQHRFFVAQKNKDGTWSREEYLPA